MAITVKALSWTSFTAYAIANGLTYSWSFWRAFDINVLQYSAINDLLPSILFSIIIPILLIIAAILISYAYSLLIDFFIFKKADKILKRYQSYTLKNKGLSLSVLMYRYNVAISLIGAVIAVFVVPKDWKPLFIIFVPSIVACYLIIEKTMILHEFGKFRNLAIFTLAFMPAGFYSVGTFNAQNIINGVKTYIISSDTPCTTDSHDSYRYIATISDKVFALSLKDKSVCIFKYNFLKLTPEPLQTYNQSLPNDSA